MSEPTNVPTGIKPKKSVALSGVVAGNTALCTVGRTGNDLHYRGYDILDIAERCEFEEEIGVKVEVSKWHWEIGRLVDWEIETSPLLFIPPISVLS